MTDVQLYGQVESGLVVDGPRYLPTSWRTDKVEILAFDRLTDPTPYGWWPWIEEPEPGFDPVTHRVEPVVRLDAKAKHIIRGYRVVERDPVAETVPDEVFDYQFAGEAEARGIITREECDAWVGPGVVPEKLVLAIKEVIPDDEIRRPIELFLMGSKQFPRNHPNTEALAPLFGLDTAEKINEFFISASKR